MTDSGRLVEGQDDYLMVGDNRAADHPSQTPLKATRLDFNHLMEG